MPSRVIRVCTPCAPRVYTVCTEGAFSGEDGDLAVLDPSFFVKICQKFVKNCQKLSKIVKNFDKICQNLSKFVKICQNLSKMVKNNPFFQ